MLKKYKLIQIKKQDSYSVKNETVYDLEIENNHNYTVGKEKIIVHNSACTTKNATGILSPMASLLQEISEEAKSYTNKPAIIADGGINSCSNFVKALALGADICMMGSLIAQTKESPAEIAEVNGALFKLYHGSASYEIQSIYKEQPKFIEGAKRYLPYSGETIDELFDKLQDGLLSSMSYFDAKNIIEYHNNVDFYYE